MWARKSKWKERKKNCEGKQNAPRTCLQVHLRARSLTSPSGAQLHDSPLFRFKLTFVERKKGVFTSA